MPEPNLNDLVIRNHEYPVERLYDYTTMSRDATVYVYFRDIEFQLLNRIQEADLVVGCVAWLTNEKVIDAMAKVPHGVAIVVQKEDFLRPDVGHKAAGWKHKLRGMYGRLRMPHERHRFPGVVGRLSGSYSHDLDPVRCAGPYNRAKDPAFPRMHHKFLVFCSMGAELPDDPRNRYDEPILPIHPYAVWTGSYNITQNGSRSMENALLVKDQRVVQAYYDEWAQVEAISEPLDWASDACDPEWCVEEYW
jgi:hypothetical protein